MSDHKGCRKVNGESRVKTSLFIQTYEFSWAIENFPEWPETFEITSDEFQPANDIILYALFERFVDDSGDSKSYLKFISKGNNTSFESQYHRSILDSEGKVFQDVEEPVPFVYDDDNRIAEFTIYPEKLKEFSKSTKDKILIFKWVMKASGLTTKNVSRHRLESSTDFLPTLVEDFKTMFIDSLYTDFSILVENSVLRVHKSVLCARSPIFAKMLASPMDEKEKDAIKIVDIELPNLKRFIEFLYSGNIMPDADFESVCALYYAADKYDVPSLRNTCSDVLLAKLDAESACRVLSLSNRHSDNQLKDSVLDFMQFEFDAILGSESWIDFVKTETELAVEVMKLRGQKFEKRTGNMISE